MIRAIALDRCCGLAGCRPDADGLDEARVNGPVHGDDAIRGYEEARGFKGPFLGHHLGEGMRPVVPGAGVHVQHARRGLSLVELQVDFNVHHPLGNGGEKSAGNIDGAGVEPPG